MKVCSVCQRCFEDSAANCTEENHGSLIAARSGTREIVPNYRLDFLLERGATGEIYAATRIADGESCVVEFPAPGAPEETQNLREGFLNEAHAAASIIHPNLVRVYESGMLESGECFVVTEAGGGKTLRENLKNDGAFSEAIAVTVVRQAAEGLQAAHAVGIAHRAVNPSNIILIDAGQSRPLVKVRNFDFGGIRQRILLQQISGDSPRTGDLSYMSPEQCRNQAVDARTDIYSLGVVLYETLTGHLPFDAPKSEAIRRKPFNEQPLERLSYDNKALLTHILRLSLQERPSARPQSVVNFARQLRHIEQLLAKSSMPLPSLSESSVSVPPKKTSASNIAPKLEGRLIGKNPPIENSPVADSAETAHEIVSPASEESVEKDKLINTEPIFQSEFIFAEKEKTDPHSTPIQTDGKEDGNSFVINSMPVERKDFGNSDSFISEPILIGKKEITGVQSLGEPISLEKKGADSFKTEPIFVGESALIAAAPNFETALTVAETRGGRVSDAEDMAAQPSEPIVKIHSGDNYIARRTISARRSLLIGVGLLASLALVGLGAFFYDRQSQPSANLPGDVSSTTSPASQRLANSASSSKDTTPTDSDALEMKDSAAVEKMPSTVAENHKKGSPRAETPVNSAAAKQTGLPKEAAIDEKAATGEQPQNQGKSDESPNQTALETELNTSFNHWISATNSRDIEGQMNYYAPKVNSYYRTRNASQNAVRAEKRRVFSRASVVDIQTGKPEISLSPDGQTATMRFHKKYVIKEGRRSRSGEVVQELQWVKSGSGWRIVSERDVKVINR